ncbi:CDP-alcohol phosphatidyltransferase family protein [Tateyamaria pelophila]|uniref:CDP-alcohol phosphatidyltransferase family protein n=1 Tax=Tateyamaria pelophila TaxID=328415 RepID=UPI001CBDA400|nr:CDP-alcohol phosphatidyltransferase family protein [Tateyamaria pelophila]
MATSAHKQETAIAPVKLVGEGVSVWGMTSAERLRRMFARLKVTDVSAWDGATPAAEACYVVSADHAYAQVLLADLSRTVGTVLTSNGRPVAAYVSEDRAANIAQDIADGQLSRAADLTSCEPDQLSSAYDETLRKREVPYVMALTPETVRAVEQRTFDGSYKGVTDFVTLYCWPKPAIAVVRWCATARITPNMVTTLSLVLVLAAMWLFWNGFFITGIIAAWLMTFLDTVDGKLARVTVTSTKFGNVFDHGIDLVHPPFWYWAWVVGVAATVDNPPDLTTAFWVTVVGYVVQRLQEGIFIKAFNMEMHIWRRFDSLYRLVVARRNPNLALLTVFALFGYPAEGLIAVAVWTAVSLVVHSLQIAQALRAPRPLQSWLDH